MDIRDIVTELSNYLSHSDEFLRTKVLDLVNALEEQLREEVNNINSGRASVVIDQYKSQHEILSREFNRIPTDNKHFLERLYKAQEVLVVIDTVMYYIKWALGKCTGVNADHKIVMALRTDEEYFKEASFRWCQILSSMNSEMKLRTATIGKSNEKEVD